MCIRDRYNAGADAVYTGGLMFGARAGANNLTTEELIEALEYAHVHDRKLYLCLLYTSCGNASSNNYF